MRERKIKENIYAVGALDREKQLFDELIPLPDGTSYNSYLVAGREKTALIDAVDPAKENVLKENLEALKIKKIDYVISQHAEQDHSGCIGKVLEWFPGAKVVTNAKCKDLLKELLLISEEKFITISDGEEISLGDKTLKFILMPWVHWPETMATFLKEDKILFSCDFLGSHRAQDDPFVGDEDEVYPAAKRYYAEIMMPFRTSIKGHIEKVKALNPAMICPSHGPVYQRPDFIIKAHEDWISDRVKNEVVLPYVSMHGSTKVMAEHLTKALIKNGVKVIPFDISKTDIGELAMALVDAATIVIASPAVLAGPHPLAFYAVYLANMLRPKTKFFSMIGSYGWGGRMQEILASMTGNLKVEVIAPVIVKGYPKDKDFAALDGLAQKIVEAHKKTSSGGLINKL